MADRLGNRVVITVRRNEAEDVHDIEREKQFHHERAAFLHKLAQDLNLEVLEWDKTDTPEPHEFVEIAIVLVSTGAAAALMTRFKGWLDRDETTNTLKQRDVSVHGMSLRHFDVDEILASLGLRGEVR